MNLKQWVKRVGTREAARRIGAAESGVRHWVGGLRPVPADRVLDIASATEWQVTPHEIRSDLYPYPCDGIPPERRAQGSEAAA